MEADIAKETKRLLTSLLVSNPLRCTVNQLSNDFKNFIGHEIPFRKLGYNNLETYLRSIPDTVSVYGSGCTATVDGVIQDSSAHINLMVAKQKKNVPHHKLKYVKRCRNIQIPENCNIPSQLRPTQMGISPPSNSYENECSGFYSAATPSQSSCSPPQNNNNTQIVQSNVQKTVPQFEEYKSRVPREIQNNLRKLIKSFPDGLWCTELNKEYRKLFKKNLLFDLYNYRSFIDMCSDLPDIFHYVKASSDDYMLYDKNNPIPPLGQNEMILNENSNNSYVADVDDVARELNSLASSGQFKIPANVCYLSYKIPRYFPKDLAVGDVLDVHIAEIYDLSKFWICMFYGELKDLMANLNSFFNHNSNKYVMPEVVMTEGLYCVALYGGEYHRALITHLLPNQMGYIRVLFIDYGTVGDVNTNEVWYLPLDFGNKYHAQAIRARLSNIYPEKENSLWSIEAINRFRKLANSHLVAEINKVNFEDKVLEIYLADISEVDNIFFINEKLVEEGFAIFAEQQQQRSLSDPNCVPIVRHLHLCPDFNEIEMAGAPAHFDMKYIIDNNIPMHHYLPQYYDITYYEDASEIERKHEQDCKTIDYSIKPPLIRLDSEEELDLSIFPKEIRKSISSMIVSKKTVQQYSCTKKWLTDWSSPDSSSTVSNRVSPLTTADSSLVEKKNPGSNRVSPLTTADSRLGEKSTDSSVSFVKEKSKTCQNEDEAPHSPDISMSSSKFNSTNPFLNMSANPFQDETSELKLNSTNPFLYDIFDKRENSIIESKSAWGNTNTNQSNKNSTVVRPVKGRQPIINYPPPFMVNRGTGANIAPIQFLPHLLNIPPNYSFPANPFQIHVWDPRIINNFYQNGMNNGFNPAHSNFYRG